MSTVTKKIIRGGIGDILLALDSINREDEYIVFSHFSQALDLVAPYTSKATLVPMLQAVGSVSGEVVPEVTYPHLNIPEKSMTNALGKFSSPKGPTVGIHPIGSKLSIGFDTNYGRPLKFMPADFVSQLIVKLKDINKDVNILLFCAPEEKSLYSSVNATIVSEPYIWDSIAAVSLCDFVIGVDSAIKTVSALLHKPTLVLIGDYQDSGRDRFILPYKEIETIRFKDIRAALAQTLKKLEEYECLTK